MIPGVISRRIIAEIPTEISEGMLEMIPDEVPGKIREGKVLEEYFFYLIRLFGRLGRV